MKQIFQTVNKPAAKIKSFAYLTALLIACLIAACKKDAQGDNRIEAQLNNLNPQTASELRQAMAATTKYQNIQNAFADGYADISVIKPNMGYHFMRAEITDSVFEYAKPE